MILPSLTLGTELACGAGGKGSGDSEPAALFCPIVGQTNAVIVC